MEDLTKFGTRIVFENARVKIEILATSAEGAVSEMEKALAVYESTDKAIKAQVKRQS